MQRGITHRKIVKYHCISLQGSLAVSWRLPSTDEWMDLILEQMFYKIRCIKEGNIIYQCLLMKCFQCLNYRDMKNWRELQFCTTLDSRLLLTILISFTNVTFNVHNATYSFQKQNILIRLNVFINVILPNKISYISCRLYISEWEIDLAYQSR